MNSNPAISIEECVRKLKSVNYALQDVELKGRKNLDILLGSMQAIDLVIAALERGMDEISHPIIEEITDNSETEESN